MSLIHGARALVAACAICLTTVAANAGTLSIQFGVAEPAQREAFTALVNDFRAANPDVEVRLALMDDAAQRQSLPASLAGDAPPDVFNGPAGDAMRAQARRGELDDLSDLWKANTWWNTFPATVASVGDRQYAVPYQVYPWGLFFRHDVLERAGLREAPRDLSGLLTACSKLRRAGFTPIALGARDGAAVAAWFDFIDLRANGFDFHAQLLDGKASYNDSNVRRSFLMWRQLIDARCFDANAAALDSRGAQSLLFAGRAGMVLAGTVFSTDIPAIVRPQVDFVRFPTIDSGLASSEPVSTDAFLVAARARNKAEARRFLSFAAGSAQQAKLARALGSLPANRYAPVAGSVLDLDSYKVLSEAKANVVSGYDRGVPADMARAGVKAFQDFLAQPGQMYPILDRLDATRATAYAAVEQAAVPVHAARKN